MIDRKDSVKHYFLGKKNRYHLTGEGYPETGYPMAYPLVKCDGVLPQKWLRTKSYSHPIPFAKSPVTAVTATQAIFFSVEQVPDRFRLRPPSPRVPICAGKSRPNTCAAEDKEID